MNVLRRLTEISRLNRVRNEKIKRIMNMAESILKDIERK